MSILINNMKMPESCDMCWALEDYGDYPKCRITEEQRGYNFNIREKRMDNCPLVPVPPHCDLIGRNPLIDIAMHLRNRAKDEYAKRVIGSVIRYIAEAPTIIPTDVPDNNVGNIPAEED